MPFLLSIYASSAGYIPTLQELVQGLWGSWWEVKRVPITYISAWLSGRTLDASGSYFAFLALGCGEKK